MHLTLLMSKTDLSEMGFEPMPTYVDQNAPILWSTGKVHLESGALDRSATLTFDFVIKACLISKYITNNMKYT